MKIVYANILKTGLTLITGWVGAALLLLSLTFLSQSAFADSTILVCDVSAKYTAGLVHIYSREDLDKWKFSVRIAIDSDDTATASRCSYSAAADDVNCDTYQMDLVQRDKNTGIVKLYHFDSQFNIQLFGGEAGTFIEDNGRGDFSYGVCK